MSQIQTLLDVIAKPEAAWEEIQRLRSMDDPELDATDGAHASWWRAHDHTSAVFCNLVNQILDGNDDGQGVCHEPWESTRRRLLALVAENQELAEACEKQFNEGVDHGHAMARVGLNLE